MKYVNCDVIEYLHALDTAESRGTKEERAILQQAAKGVFRNIEFGRHIALCTWLMVSRASVRGNLALAGLLPRQSRETFQDGEITRTRLIPYTEEQMMEARMKQALLIARLRTTCPVFFDGMIVEDQGEGATTISASGEVTVG